MPYCVVQKVLQT